MLAPVFAWPVGCGGKYPSDALAIQKIGVDRRNQGGDQQQDKDPGGPEVQKGGHDHHQSGDDPEKAGQPVSAVPVLLAVQGPGQLEAHGVALLGLGQVVAQQT